MVSRLGRKEVMFVGPDPLLGRMARSPNGPMCVILNVQSTKPSHNKNERKETMSTSKFLIFLGLILALPVVAWSPGNALAQEKAARAVAIEQAKKAVREQVRNDIAIKGKGKVTINDQAKFFGKVTPADQKAAVKVTDSSSVFTPG